MIVRQIFEEANFTLSQFRAMCITGPRQSGKTTLSKMLFKGKPYISFEKPDVQHAAEKNIASFMKQYKAGAVLDEVQRIPDVFRQLQGMLDDNRRRGQFILTGSNNFLLQEQMSQSLAGRAGYLELLPLSYGELKKAKLASDSIHKHILTGGYPEIWSEKLQANKWMGSYVQTYLQRDVRMLRNITNLGAFNRFVALCAGYAGQIINKDDLANKTGVDNKTVQAWLTVLESSYIIYLLQPWHNNLNKRVIKSPKLYFYDTGLLCYLLGYQNIQAVSKAANYGALFENWVMTEIRKNRSNSGLHGGMYFYRDSAGNEVDLVLEKNDHTIGIEIKSSKKISSSDLTGLKYWQKYQPNSSSILVNGGNSGKILDDRFSLMSFSEIDNL